MDWASAILLDVLVAEERIGNLAGVRDRVRQSSCADSDRRRWAGSDLVAVTTFCWEELPT
jgi:hypothetical protein